MTAEQKLLCELLSSSLFDVQFTAPKNADWNKIKSEAIIQTVAGLIPETDGLDDQVLFKIEAKSLRILHEQNKLGRLFASHSLPMAILKGTAAAIYYPRPIDRTMGDIDFIVPEVRFEEAEKLLEQNGYILECPISLSSPRHSVWKKNGIFFELHHHFSHEDLYIDDYVSAGLSHTVWAYIGEAGFPMLPPLPNGLVLLVHMRSHLKSGMGLRQIIDWMMYVDKVLNDEFWENEFKTVAESKGLDTLAITTTRMCQLFLGLPNRISWCESADIDLCEELLDLVFSSGNFGRKNSVRVSVETVSTRISQLGLFTYLQTAGEHNWIAYHRNSRLKMFCWIYQFFRIVRRGFKTNRGILLAEEIYHSKERYDLLKRLKLFEDIKA